jgi:hypothetical protein
MNALEMIISKVVSAREMIDVANEALSYNQKDRAEKMTMAAYEFLGYFIEEFDEKFKDAWQATVGDLRDGDTTKECQNAWNDFWEENYYPEEALNHMNNKTNLNEQIDHIRKEGGYEWTPEVKDKIKKWILPVEMDDPSGQYYVSFPEDLLDAANLQEGDQVYWVDNNDGTYTIRKVTQPIQGNEC